MGTTENARTPAVRRVAGYRASSVLNTQNISSVASVLGEGLRRRSGLRRLRGRDTSFDPKIVAMRGITRRESATWSRRG